MKMLKELIDRLYDWTLEHTFEDGLLYGTIGTIIVYTFVVNAARYYAEH